MMGTVTKLKFDIIYKGKLISIPWKENYALLDAIKYYKDSMGYDGVSYLYWEIPRSGCVVSGGYYAVAGATYIAIELSDMKNPCVTMEETETYVSPFTGKVVS
jgi:hypothetical protein